MLRNYIKVFFRNTAKNPFYSSINIIGLSIGLACSIVAFLYIINELSYNKHIENHDKIYRIGSGIQSEMLNDSMPQTLYEVGTALLEQVPEIESVARIVNWYYGSALVKVDNDYYPDVKLLITDSLFLDVLSFNLLQGNPSDFLQSPTKIAISQSFAEKVFGKVNPIGKIIHFNGENLEVAWLLEDPEHTTIDFELLLNFDYTKPFKEYLRLDVHTFFRTKEKLSKSTEKKIREISDKIILDGFSDWTNKTNSPIQPIDEIYLKSNLGSELGKRGNLRTLYIFGFLAGIILLIAVINYVNLLTSRSEYRNKEVGVRKVSGADKKRLRFQFLSESVILSVLSLFIAFVISELIIYMVNSKMQLSLSVFQQSNILIFVIYFIVAVIIGVLSGIYPAFVLSNYSAIKVIKGIFDSKGNSNLLKIILVFIQFTISTLLIIAIFIFNSQIIYLKQKDLGFNEKNLVVLPKCTWQINKNYESIRDELISYHKIENVSASQSIPGWGRSGQGIRKKTDDPSKIISIAENRVQDYYTETMGIEILKGRSFDPEFDDNRSILINETTAKLLGVENPIGLEVVTNRESVIVGVVKDYHYHATTAKLEPLYLSNYRVSFNNIVIRINPNDKLTTLHYLKDVILKYDPNYFWNYFFLEDMFQNQYKVEERLFTMIIWGSGIALILSVLGLFALTSYTVSKRFKEIGIRKTFGASVSIIVRKLNRDIIKWVLLTNIIAWPLAYFIMKNWLQNYPYHVDINWIYFVLASAISVVIALVTISFQAIKAARMNPVDAIRYE